MADLILIDRATIAQALSWIHYMRREYGMDEPREERALRAALAQAEPDLRFANPIGLTPPQKEMQRRQLTQQAEPVQGPFALPCPTPKACREHCCHGACLPAPQQAEPVQNFRLTECVFVGPPPAPHEDWHHAISAMLREKHISGLRISTATADDWYGIKEKA